MSLSERVEAGENSEELVIAISDACGMKTPHGNPLTDLTTAEMLIPEGDGITWTLSAGPWVSGYCRVFNINYDGDVEWDFCASAPTPALALCGAALRARGL